MRNKHGDGGMIALLFVVQHPQLRERLITFMSCLQHDEHNLDGATQSLGRLADQVPSAAKFLRRGKRQSTTSLC